MAVDKVARRYVWATAGVAALGTAWYCGIPDRRRRYRGVRLHVRARSAACSLPRPSITCPAAVDLDPVAWRFWRALLVALALITVGYGWLAVDMLTHAAEARTRSMPVPAAACVAIGFGIAIWAVARVPIVATGGVEWWRMLLDRTIAFLGCAAVLWYVGLAPMLSRRRAVEQAGDGPGRARVPASRSARATKVSYVAGGPVDRAAIRLIAASGGVTAGLVAVLAVRFGYAGGVPAQAIVMPLAPVLATLGRRGSVALQSRASPRHGPRRRAVALPGRGGGRRTADRGRVRRTAALAGPRGRDRRRGGDRAGHGPAVHRVPGERPAASETRVSRRSGCSTRSATTA